MTRKEVKEVNGRKRFGKKSFLVDSEMSRKEVNSIGMDCEKADTTDSPGTWTTGIEPSAIEVRGGGIRRPK